MASLVQLKDSDGNDIQKWMGVYHNYAYVNFRTYLTFDRISREGREFFDVNVIYVFRSGSESYWHICFGDGSLCHQINELSENPTDNINLGSPKKSLPKYLSASESIRLLKNIQSDFYERDYCIIVFFLNCGMRLAELITISRTRFPRNTRTGWIWRGTTCAGPMCWWSAVTASTRP